MNKNNQKKFSISTFESALTLLASKLISSKEIEQPFLDKYINELIDDMYRTDPTLNLMNAPMEVCFDWSYRARNTGKVLWSQTAQRLSEEFDKLYKKTKLKEYKVASAMLCPTDETYIKYHTRFKH